MTTSAAIAATIHEKHISARLAVLPLVLTRGEILEELRRCNLGGRDYYDNLVAIGSLKPVPGLQGAKQARFDTSAFFHKIVAPALGVSLKANGP